MLSGGAAASDLWIIGSTSALRVDTAGWQVRARIDGFGAIERAAIDPGTADLILLSSTALKRFDKQGHEVASLPLGALHLQPDSRLAVSPDALWVATGKKLVRYPLSGAAVTEWSLTQVAGDIVGLPDGRVAVALKGSVAIYSSSGPVRAEIAAAALGGINNLNLVPGKRTLWGAGQYGIARIDPDTAVLDFSAQPFTQPARFIAPGLGGEARERRY
jgi:hypothetical protein